MKPQESNQDDALSRVLQEWKVSAPLPPRFRENVWRKIEQNTVPAPGWLEFFGSLCAAFSKPAWAVSYVAVLLVLGSAAGYLRAQAANAHTDQVLSARYVQMIDPYQMPGR